jgi:hypothetical protein
MIKMITFELCNIFEQIWYSESILVVKKWPEIVVKWPKTKVVSFFSGQTLYVPLEKMVQN